ncbi:MAG: polyprenyl synthetase family protein, partial [Methanomassiliicoccaceae archaeon]|nr:polyprenyl synthetase family protein [Methanomassiliicoccaceae archaeon]
TIPWLSQPLNGCARARRGRGCTKDWQHERLAEHTPMNRLSLENIFHPVAPKLEAVEAELQKMLQSDIPVVGSLSEHVQRGSGKRLRPALVLLASRFCGCTSDEDVRFAAIIELIHTATLIHDDINDNGEIRRGRQTVHKKYTISKAVILGDLMFAMGFRHMSADAKIVDTVVNASTAMAESEFIQKEFEHRPKVTEKDYFNIIRGKTAMPIFAAARTGAYLADAGETEVNAVSDFALGVGMAFQIADDVLDVTGDHRHTGKKIGVDIAEGKPTLPVIYAMADPRNGKRIREIFCKKDASDDELKLALELIKGTGSAERCLAKAKEIAEEAIPHLRPLKDSVYKDSLTALARYIVNRDR